ncbi:MAG: LacI family DNA-binding transcriptional regulator [Caldilinea sp.]|nr:LacI family DNA-binding transcriptional regulator [Caldilinea sp.]MCB0042862.1 LacI family DNA-binding transcriptional regulator [Caldilinea sp.]MCB0049778.1 LacI family DNA-binding transcriptional regulator [Caldilinea sp.]MCB0147222.1 LacI family DNA-binding transcriptional regulator [Caldilineaceae bacterium]MCW5840532.1 LacI family DNA-binding transcriptional regulator [Caldilinea sp.]
MSRNVTGSRATIADVAKLAGVSTATVSRVINRAGKVNAETEARVRAAIHELGYLPHIAARGLASNRTNTIGLIFPEISSHYYATVLRGIEQVTMRERYALLIVSVNSLNREDLEMLLPLGEHNTDGLIIFTNSLPADIMERLHAHGFPMVLLHHTPPATVAIPHIHFANESGAYTAVEHLIVAHGCRRIVLLRGPADNEDAAAREAGYRRAIANHGLPVAPELLLEGEFNEAVAEAAIATFLGRAIEFDAIFATDDESAWGAMTALRAAGRRVPEDVAIAGFDDGLLSRHLTPALTTVHAPIQEAGCRAAEMLLCAIHARDHGRVSEGTAAIVLPTHLVVRGSCGCSGGEQSIALPAHATP